MTKKEKEEHVAELCAQHNCKEKIAKIHAEQWVKNGYHPHPHEGFRAWWEPQGFSPNGASYGGHREAWRCWVKRETGERRWYGMSTLEAWNADWCREEFREWAKNGMDPEHHNWDSTTAPEDKMRAVIRDCIEEIRKGVFTRPLKTLRQSLDNMPSPTLPPEQQGGA